MPDFVNTMSHLRVDCDCCFDGGLRMELGRERNLKQDILHHIRTQRPAEAERLMRWGFITARVSLWLSFPMLFFMGAASHYPFLSSVAR